MSRACIEAKILLLKLQKSLGDNAAPKLAESSLIVSEAAEYLISHSQKLGVRSASEKLKTPFVCNAVKEVVLVIFVFYFMYRFHSILLFMHIILFVVLGLFWALCLGRFRVLCWPNYI